MNRNRRLVPLAGAALALAALVGCAQNPQVAAQVGSEKISVDDLQLMTQALCTEQSASQSAATRPQSPIAAVTDSAMAALIQSAIDRQYAAANDIPGDGQAVSQQLDRLAPLLARVPAEDRDRTRELIRELFTGQQAVFNAALAKLKSTGQQADQEVLQEAVSAIEADYAKKVDITINPRYDSAGADHRGDGFGSLSKAVSSDAKAASSAQADPGWVAQLPANQKCG